MQKVSQLGLNHGHLDSSIRVNARNVGYSGQAASSSFLVAQKVGHAKSVWGRSIHTASRCAPARPL
jgi:hypothetical protein